MQFALPSRFDAVLGTLRYNRKVAAIWNEQGERAAVAVAPGLQAHVANLKRDGYSVLPGYYSRELCAKIRSQIDAAIVGQPENVQADPKGADHRLYGAENLSPEIRAFHDDPFIRSVGEAYGGWRLTNLSTLGARLEAKADNLGSGQGWHRDSFHFQYKGMVYLDDVGPDSGPFQLMRDSHKPLQVLLDTFRANLPTAPRSRLTDAEVAQLDPDGRRTKTFTAEAGTLVLFDSTTIHRGMPIRSGLRYALTNYFYLPCQLGDTLTAKFAPYVRAPAYA